MTLVLCLDSGEDSTCKSWALSAYNFMCGASPIAQKLTKEEKIAAQTAMTSIKENPFWSRFCDYNAMIAVGITCFIIGFYV